jgi:serine/threonine-protein kinase
MAPEQTKNVRLDRRVDLFAMGVILWEVLAGQRLFKTDSEAATLSRLLIEPIPRPSQVAKGVPHAFDEVAAKALQRDPDARYQTAADMADAIERGARLAAPDGVGVASPREVAAYMQRVIGQEIAAQRESVRAWLAQSEPSQVQVAAGPAPPVDLPPNAEVTGRIPLDDPDGAPTTARGLGRSPAEPPPSARPRTGALPIIPATPAVPHAPWLVGASPAALRPGPGGPGPAPQPGPSGGARPPVGSPPPREALGTTLRTPQPQLYTADSDDAEPTTLRNANATSLSSASMTLPQSGAPYGPSVALVEPDPLSVPRPPMQRSRATLVIALLAVVGIAGVSFFWWRQTGAGGEIGPAAPSPAVATETAPAAAASTAMPPMTAAAVESSAPAGSAASAQGATAPPLPTKAGPGPGTRPIGKAGRKDKGDKTKDGPPTDDLSNPYR